MGEARSIKSQARRGGIACPAPGQLVRETQCNKDPCPIDCKVTDWARDGECSKSCEGGEVRQTRQILHASGNGGLTCPKDMVRVVACNTHPCGGIDCGLSDWVNEKGCSLTCGTGVQKQYRSVKQHAKFGGLSCKNYPLTRQVVCNPTPCPLQGFDPIASGRLTGFNFDLARYCEHPSLCKTPEEIEGLSEDIGILKGRSAAKHFEPWILVSSVLLITVL